MLSYELKYFEIIYLSLFVILIINKDILRANTVYRVTEFQWSIVILSGVKTKIYLIQKTIVE